ncbi:MAG: hypothetical protein KatS3mg115_1980 [Candidatus Poribacteria bacterium]|nr:MAG: hypothetical protein KatS3mg115_1980 [Candidatus Poribacteria bacterium]
MVIITAPEPGAEIARGTAVDLLVSKGPPPVPFPMPTLVGRPFDAVQEELRQRHLFFSRRAL